MNLLSADTVHIEFDFVVGLLGLKARRIRDRRKVVICTVTAVVDFQDGQPKKRIHIGYGRAILKPGEAFSSEEGERLALQNAIDNLVIPGNYHHFTQEGKNVVWRNYNNAISRDLVRKELNELKTRRKDIDLEIQAATAVLEALIRN